MFRYTVFLPGETGKPIAGFNKIEDVEDFINHYMDFLGDEPPVFFDSVNEWWSDEQDLDQEDLDVEYESHKESENECV